MLFCLVPFSEYYLEMKEFFKLNYSGSINSVLNVKKLSSFFCVSFMSFYVHYSSLLNVSNKADPEIPLLSVFHFPRAFITDNNIYYFFFFYSFSVGRKLALGFNVGDDLWQKRENVWK